MELQQGKAGKSHSPIHALVPCGVTLMRWKSGGAKSSCVSPQQEDGDTSHWSRNKCLARASPGC